ncbi:hypothetical protein Poli38472_014383 [Pythium oligandrum]|uniref:Uncharacterized protein n=1 Tax=Pythium oligandrum TaxID=41045 RepID=A0A8K1FBZ6_PYTOL|nr:hypothetical protein Poli38472_014383 [Pythium oligandrum]|eukprot:TMW57780.1 hypothetical protein Poli38472_014383 [Pythium oligandrum]
MVIEVKQTLRQGAVGQVVSELVALDLLTDYAVMALLTDLNSNWEFYWISESDDSRIRIHTTTVTQPGEAFQVIRTLLEQTPDEGVDITLPFLNVPVKRRKLAQTLPSIVEGREGGGIREAIERYYDIASILGPDIDMARAVANQVVRSIPAFSYYT